MYVHIFNLHVYSTHIDKNKLEALPIDNIVPVVRSDFA